MPRRLEAAIEAKSGVTKYLLVSLRAYVLKMSLKHDVQKFKYEYLAFDSPVKLLKV